MRKSRMKPHAARAAFAHPVYYSGTHQDCMQLTFLQGRTSFMVIDEADHSKSGLQVQYVYWINIIHMQREHCPIAAEHVGS